MQKQVAISGETGFIGNYLTQWLQERGHLVKAIPRYLLQGDPADLAILLEGSQVVIHLAGAPINKRWTPKNKALIYDSRILTTRHVVEAMSQMEKPPGMFICASGVNIYPDDGVFTEDDTRISHGFLAEVCRDWELEALKANAFARVLNFRLGVVLGRNGGALPTMALPFKMGMGGWIGNGRQMLSWIHIEDLARAVDHAIGKKTLHGPVNISSPHPVSNKDFSKALARALHRPAIFPVPAFAVKWLLGEAASLVTKGVTALPGKLQRAGFQFRYPMVRDAFREIYSSGK